MGSESAGFLSPGLALESDTMRGIVLTCARENPMSILVSFFGAMSGVRRP